MGITAVCAKAGMSNPPEALRTGMSIWAAIDLAIEEAKEKGGPVELMFNGVVLDVYPDSGRHTLGLAYATAFGAEPRDMKDL